MYKSLYKAVRNGSLKAVKEMVESGIDPGYNDNIAIRTAALGGLLDIFKFLITDQRVDPAAKDNYAIKYASCCGHVEIVRILLQDHRVNPAAENNFAFSYACTSNKLDVVKLLLNDNRVDPTDKGDIAFKIACFRGHIEIIKLLLNDGRVNPNAGDGYCIGAASENGHIEVVKLLLEFDSIDPTNRENKALKLAHKNGHFEIVRLLRDAIKRRTLPKYNYINIGEYIDMEFEQKVIYFINNQKLKTIGDLFYFLKENMHPIKARWVFYFMGLYKKITEHQIFIFEEKGANRYGPYIYGEVYFWEKYFIESEEKQRIIDELAEEGIVVNEKELHKIYVEEGYGKMDFYLDSQSESELYNNQRKFWAEIDQMPERVSDDEYCEICQESPCRCSGREFY